MRVLVACEFSGVVRRAFRERGHDAWSCDLLSSEDGSEFHIQGDIMKAFGVGPWDLMIAHPPCTYLCNSGVCWLTRKEGRWEQMRDGAEFFKMFLESSVPRIAVENPIMHKYAVEIIGRRQDQIVQPWMFGHTEQKATGLWLKDLPCLEPTNDVREQMMRLSDGERQRGHWMSPGPDRWKERSRTYEGIAAAMADQWGAPPTEAT